MTENRKGASCGNTDSARNAGQTTTKGRVTILSQQEGSKQGKQQDFSEKIMQLLPLGEASAVSMADLARWMGTDERTIRQAVFDARRAGAVICSGNSGYFLPCNREELKRHYLSMRKRAMSCLSSIKAARRALQVMDETESGQMRLDDAGRPVDNQRTTKEEPKGKRGAED